MFDKYLVKSNDSIKSLANKFKTDPRILMDINNLRYESDLRVGMELVVPKNKERYFNVYVIEKGDSLYRIAERYNINPTLLASLNGLNMEDYIYPAQELLIPKNGYSYYITAEGDTIDTVASLFKISPIDLMNQNETIYLLKDQVLVSKKNARDKG